ncbi:NAD-dependent epimerase/dehydratase family protein [Pandoraea anhela]|uniref:Semialdehyde dehydrogenase n=1 Tax=Pandoraea anhela TaxID=2508295 RepID=A0A5E4X816_9BURK|nr:NAD-dependent epimerase/dehydratase family protein [Pandoraea anhela]VVE32417.1 semialdehyde dehydrogenase [Pandoraea anhela]
MRIVLIGATGMVGQGVLRACLAASDVTEILVLGRRPLPAGYDDPRLKVVTVPDLAAFTVDDPAFRHVDACFFCAGVSSFGMAEAAYRAVTYDLTLAVAQTLLHASPGMAMVYVSGAGADSTEHGRSMWARVRGQTENALRRLPFGRVAIFRPGAILTEDGVESRTAVYRRLYVVLGPLLRLARWLSPTSVLTTRIIGDAMLNVVRHGVPHAILTPADIHRLGNANTA